MHLALRTCPSALTFARADNGATENNIVMTLKSYSDSFRLVGCQKRDNREPLHLKYMTHVRHVGPKRVTHKFCYTINIFNKTYENKNVAYENKNIKQLIK
jgi:hypothetical protein